MKKRMSLYKNLVFNDIKRFGTIGIFYSILLFLLIPFNVIEKINRYNIRIEFDEKQQIINELLYIFERTDRFVIMIVLIVSIILGILLIYEIQNSRSCSHIHSLPITKKEILFNKIFTGLILIFVPFILNFIVTISIISFSWLSPYVSVILILKYFLLLFLCSLIFFIQSIFIGTFVSNIILHAAIAAVFNLIPWFLVVLIEEYLNLLFFCRYNSYSAIGVAAFDGIARSHIMPLVGILNGWITAGELKYSNFIFLIFSIVIWICLSYFVYLKRKNENVTSTITIDLIKCLFKYVLTFFSMLILSTILAGISNWGIFGIALGGVIGAFIGYYVSDMIIKRELKVVPKMGGYFIYITIMLIFLGLSQTNILFNYNPPKLNDVESVTVIDDKLDLVEIAETKDIQYSIKDKEKIKKVIDMHKYLLSFKSNRDRENWVYINYKLKNGKNIKRMFKGKFDKNYNAYIREISKDENYKKANYSVFYINENLVEKIVIDFNKKGYEIVDKDKIKKVISNIKEDILNNQYKYKEDDFKGKENDEINVMEIIYKQQYDNYKQATYITSKHYLLDSTTKWVNELQQ